MTAHLTAKLPTPEPLLPTVRCPLFCVTWHVLAFANYAIATALFGDLISQIQSHATSCDLAFRPIVASALSTHSREGVARLAPYGAWPYVLGMLVVVCGIILGLLEFG